MAGKKTRKKTLFGKAKSPRLAKAISIVSPAAFKASIKKVKALKGISALKKKRALVLAKNRALAQLARKNLSAKERKQFAAIAKIRIPKVL